MRISDWSSDVCSADLLGACRQVVGVLRHVAFVDRQNRLVRRVWVGQLAAARSDSSGLLQPAVIGGDRAVLVAGHLGADCGQALAELRSVRWTHRGHGADAPGQGHAGTRSEEHTSELQSLMRISYAVFCLKKKKNEQR